MDSKKLAMKVQKDSGIIKSSDAIYDVLRTPVDSNNKPDTRYFNWDNVANDWLTWLRKNPTRLKPKK